MPIVIRTDLIDAAVEEGWRVGTPSSDHQRGGAKKRGMIRIARDQSVDRQTHGRGSDVVAPHDMGPFAVRDGHIQVVIVARQSRGKDSMEQNRLLDLKSLGHTCRSPYMAACIVGQSAIPCFVW